MTDSLIRLNKVEDKTGLKKSMVYDLISKDEFPKPIKIGDRAVAWIDREVDQWVQNKIPESRQVAA
jgi:prophage regulatory protein